MIIAHIRVSGVTAACKRRSQIPARLVGGKVVIEYADPVWAELNKTAVFRGAVTRDVVNIGELVEIPPEVLEKVGSDVYFGIEGRNADGTLVIPLIEAQLGKVMASTDPSGDPSTAPELPVWQQILDLIGNLNDLTTDAKSTLVEAINEAARRGGGSVDEETVWDIVDEYLKKNPPTVAVPTKLSQFENDAGFITRLVADLENYYAKSQTYSKTEIDGKISAIPKFSIKAVNSLPTTGISETTVYLLSTGSGSDLYTEYIYVDGEWEVLGSQRVDLTGYATKEWVGKNYQPKGEYLTKVPEGYAKESDVPKNPEDIGAQPSGDYALRSEIPSVPVQSVNGKTGAVQLSAADVGARASDWMPTAQQVGALPSTYTPPNQTAQQVGADPAGTASSAVAGHNVDTASHEDIRLGMKRIADQLTAFFDSDDKTLDELSEIVAYITSNKSLIDSITTSKVSVSDIVNNLTANVSNKPLSAAQGVVLKGLIDTLSNSLSGYQPKGDYALKSELPAVPVKSVNGKTGAVQLTASDVGARPSSWTPSASQVGADPSGTAANAVSAHNQSQEPHPDIRESVRQLSENKADKTSMTLGRDANGLLYLYIDGVPAGTGVELPTGGIDGYITEDKQIIFNNLPDGEYTLAYVDENGNTVPIGSLEKDTNVYYTVTNSLTNCTNSNSATQAVQGGSYSATITAKSGYELKSVTVTMGGSPVSVSGGTISIADVTGNIVITAVAEETKTGPTNFADPTSADWKTGVRLTTDINQTTDLTGGIATNYIATQNGDIVSVEGINFNDNNNRIAHDNGANGENIHGIGRASAYATTNTEAGYFKDVTYDNNSVTLTVTCTTTRMRFSGLATGTSNDVVINIKRNGEWL